MYCEESKHRTTSTSVCLMHHTGLLLVASDLCTPVHLHACSIHICMFVLYVQYVSVCELDALYIKTIGVIVVSHQCGHHYCMNNGICTRGEHETCICQPGFTGHFCEQEICKPILPQHMHTYPLY